MNGWPCLAAARRAVGGPRRPFRVAGCDVGSLDDPGAAALAAWPETFRVDADGGLSLHVAAGERNAVLASVNNALRSQGLIRAWRDEPYALFDRTGMLCGIIERASSRFWGALTFGAHANGYVADPVTGRPSHLWIARRSWTKATDPGMLDNLVGGGVPHGQTPRQALQREAWEEAGLEPAQLAGLRAGRVLELACDIPEGWQHEWLYAYDLELPAGLAPRNQDGEVAEHHLLPVQAALHHAASGAMTTDAALATLDFALRHGLLAPDEASLLAPRLAALCVSDEQAARFDPP